MIIEILHGDHGAGRLRVIGLLGHTLHETDTMPWDTKHPITRAEILWAVKKTGVPHADLYDAVRRAQHASRRAA